MKFFKSSLLNSILFFVVGILLLTNKSSVVNYIPYVIGILLIVIGAIKLHLFVVNKKFYNKFKFTDLLTSIIGIGMGIIALISTETVMGSIRIILGIWILYNGINKLIIALKEKSFHSKEVKTLLIILFLIIICGIVVICIKKLSFNALGLFIVIYSVLDLTAYILNSKEEKNKDTTVIINAKESIETKEESYEIEKK